LSSLNDFTMPVALGDSPLLVAATALERGLERLRDRVDRAVDAAAGDLLPAR